MALGLTQAQLAERLGQSQHYVSRTEIGDRRLDVFELDAICAALHTTLEEVWSHLRPLLSPVSIRRSLSSLSPPNPGRPVKHPHTNKTPASRARRSETQDVGADAERRVERARLLLESEANAPPSVEAVALAVGWSADHLRRMFRAVLDTSPHQVGVSARLQRARAQLLEQKEPVLRVAHECGFANASHFAQAFKREFGVSPRQLRASGTNGEQEKQAPPERSDPNAS